MSKRNLAGQRLLLAYKLQEVAKPSVSLLQAKKEAVLAGGPSL